MLGTGVHAAGSGQRAGCMCLRAGRAALQLSSRISCGRGAHPSSSRRISCGRHVQPCHAWCAPHALHAPAPGSGLALCGWAHGCGLGWACACGEGRSMCGALFTNKAGPTMRCQCLSGPLHPAPRLLRLHTPLPCCISAHTHTHTLIHTHMHTHTHSFTHTCTHTHTHTHTCMHACMHKHTHISG